jgi:hypothetical protein
VNFPTLYPTFFTATCKDWLPLLQDNNCKDIIINSLWFMVEKERIRVFGFSIMNNPRQTGRAGVAPYLANAWRP